MRFSIVPSILTAVLALSSASVARAAGADAVRNQKNAQMELERIRQGGAYARTATNDLKDITEKLSGYIALENDLYTDVMSLYRKLSTVRKSLARANRRDEMVARINDIDQKVAQHKPVSAEEVRALVKIMGDLDARSTADFNVAAENKQDLQETYDYMYDHLLYLRSEIALVEQTISQDLIPVKVDLDRTFYKNLKAIERRYTPDSYAARSILKYLPGAAKAYAKNEAVYLPFALEAHYWERLQANASDEELIELNREMIDYANMFDMIPQLSEEKAKTAVAEWASSFKVAYDRYEALAHERAELMQELKKRATTFGVYSTKLAVRLKMPDVELSDYFLNHDLGQDIQFINLKMDQTLLVMQRVLRAAYVQAFKTDSTPWSETERGANMIAIKTASEQVRIKYLFTTAVATGLLLHELINGEGIGGQAVGAVPAAAAVAGSVMENTLKKLDNWALNSMESSHVAQAPIRVLDSFMTALEEKGFPLAQLQKKHPALACQLNVLK